MRHRILHIFQSWSKDWNLTILLVWLVVMVFIVTPLDHMAVVNRVMISIFSSLLLIIGVAAVSESRTMTVVVAVFAMVAMSFRWMTHVVTSPVIESISAFSSLVFLGLLACVVLLQVFRKGPITWHRIQGAVAAYLLIGLMWGFAYHLVLLQVPDSSQPADPRMRQSVSLPNLLYFSFATLTTIGYGDITRAHPVVRSLAMLEALIGQLYPAILIGRLVSMELQFRQQK